MGSIKAVRYRSSRSVAFGPLSDYRILVGDECADVPVRTGIQNARPGYEAKLHWHPYIEILHILEGEAEAWERGQESDKLTLRAGDTLIIPAETWHAFRVSGDRPLRLLGTHVSTRRTVHYEDGTTSLDGLPPT